MSSSPLNPIPKETLHSAQGVYSSEHPYIIFGNHTERIIGDLDLAQLTAPQNQPKGYGELLALVNIFQYSEGLTDHQAAAATGQRLDWKYALHLPVGYPGIDPSALCTFRQYLAARPQAFPIYEALINNCHTYGSLHLTNNGLPGTVEVIKVNCLRNYMGCINDALIQLIEYLASEYPNWLIKVARPHWYTRYVNSSHGASQTRTYQELIQTTHSLWEDADYLVRAIQDQSSQSLRTHPEYQSLYRLWTEILGSQSSKFLTSNEGDPILLNRLNCPSAQAILSTFLLPN